MPERLPVDQSYRRFLIAALLAIAYFGTAKLGLRLAFVNASATAVWPPTGIALAALLVYGYELWPGVFVGAFAANLLTAGDAATSFGIAAGNTLEALAGAWLVNRYAGGAHAVRRSRDIVTMAILAGCISTTISPAIGVTSLALRGFAAWKDYGAIWTTWWLGDCAGSLVVAPALLVWYAQPMVRWTRAQSIEALGLFGALVLLCVALFDGVVPQSATNYPVDVLFVPVLLWVAYRFGPRESATAVLVLSAFALQGTLHGFGPFAGRAPNAALLALQLFLGVASLMSLAFGAVVAERRAAEEALHRLAVTDPLTGLANYREFTALLDVEIARSSRTGRPFSVLFLDLDHLKEINDRRGHLAGSRAIRRVADALRATCRTIDTAARIGGDEFAVILPESGSATARLLFARVCANLAVDPRDERVTASAGFAEHPSDGATAEAVLLEADRLLYNAKASRRVA
ncbi:MAG: MASE1 domain-containing protein, partial [Gemmatimonadales bacterium]